MVAKITFPQKIEAALNYNEAKLRQGKAICLAANGFLREAAEMNFYEKLEGFKRLAVLNDRAATKMIHISLNFDPSETLSDSKLLRIADTYMEKLGFGAQPFLVYKHNDAGHPHIHIVSTTIRDDGSRINTHNIGCKDSETARKEIEQAFGLVTAGQQQKPSIKLKAASPEKAVYGKHKTKQVISNIVAAVFQEYKFSSLPQFNAALRQFNVVADRGKEDSKIYKHKGLTYRILNKDGSKAGVPIKASTLPGKPTLANLENRFRSNEAERDLLKPQLKRSIESCLANAGTVTELVTGLEKQNIYTALHQNKTGFLYGVTFVDNRIKCVFNGSELGQGFSAAALQSRLATGADRAAQRKVEKGSQESVGSGGGMSPEQSLRKQPQKIATGPAHSNSVLDALLLAKESYENVPSSLLNKKRKKKKRRSDNL